MGSRTVLRFQCTVGNTVLLLIPCTELRISANASPYGCLGFVINSTLNILSARGLAHSERQRNVKNVALRSAELHNTKKQFISLRLKSRSSNIQKNSFFALLRTGLFLRVRRAKTGCSLCGLRISRGTPLVDDGPILTSPVFDLVLVIRTVLALDVTYISSIKDTAVLGVLHVSL